jgi:predicted transcriptional regulator
MTRREELFPEIRRLREDEGLIWREIGERLGLAQTTVKDYYKDPSGEAVAARKAASDARLKRPCPRCGSPMAHTRPRVETCRSCYHAELRRARACRDDDIVLMWESGLSVADIRRELGYAATSTPPELSRLMREGRIQARRAGYRRRHELERSAA